MLWGAELIARTPLEANAATEWRGGVGIRQQVSPRLATDAGLNRRVSDGAAGWSITMGAAYAFAPPGMPGFHQRAR